MPSYVTPKINTAFRIYVSLVSQADTDVFQTNPTIAAGDFQVSTDGGAFGNLATLPVVTPAGGKLVQIDLSAGEMNGDNVAVVCSDQAGNEWQDLLIILQTTANQIDDLSTLAQSDILNDATPFAGANIDQSLSTTESNIRGADNDDLKNISDEIAALSVVSFPAGSVQYTYTVTDSGTVQPVQGVDVWFTTDIAGANVIWRGVTDVFGVARDSQDRLPSLDPGTYYVWSQRVGYSFSVPDTEVVS